MPPPSELLFQELTDALQVLAMLSTHLRRMTGEVAEDAVQIQAAVDRSINIVRRLRERRT
jgi:hypothetical protein